MLTDDELAGLSIETIRRLDTMREFCRWTIRESCFEGCDIDGGSVQEKAIALGLLEPTTATADMVASSLYGECEAGDTVYVFSGPIKT